ncbi:hypothetical protein HOJ01_04370 [bacterium]|jgi:hypothetical protein|nr:hypothetical protein [bacterium]MBT6294013.1 hypothetical protein [bacterium]
MIDLRKTNYLLIVVNIVLLITLLILFFYIFNNTKESAQEIQTDFDSKINSLVDQGVFDVESYQSEHDKLSKAIDSGSLSSCNSLSPERISSCKDLIYFNEAMRDSDLSKCEAIIEDEIKRTCKMVVVDI